MGQSGFEIDGTFYPFSADLRLRDPVLIEKVTELEFPEWTNREERMRAAVDKGDSSGDALVMLGLIAVSVSRANPEWSHKEVIAFCNGVSFAEFVAVAGDDADPPDQATGPDLASSDSADSSMSTPAEPV